MSPTPPAFELELTRVIDAPRARVDAAWTDPTQLAQWFAPRPYQLIIHLEARGRQTQVHARHTCHVMTPAIAQATQGAQQGWTMTLDQLAAFCAVS